MNTSIMETRIKIVCYNQVEYWGKRKNAEKFYENAVFATEGAERDRYVNILRDLRNGWLVCTDGFSSPGTTNVLPIDTPDGTRDWGGKVHYPVEKKKPHTTLDKETLANVLGIDATNVSEKSISDKYKQGKAFLFYYNEGPIEIYHIPGWKKMWIIGYAPGDELYFNEVCRKMEDSMAIKLNSERCDSKWVNEYELP